MIDTITTMKRETRTLLTEGLYLKRIQISNPIKATAEKVKMKATTKMTTLTVSFFWIK